MGGYIPGTITGRDMNYVSGPVPSQQGDEESLDENGEQVSSFSNNAGRISCSTTELRKQYKTICFKNRKNCLSRDGTTMPVQLCVSARPVCIKEILNYGVPRYRCELIRTIMIYRAIPFDNPYRSRVVQNGDPCPCGSVCVNTDAGLKCMDHVQVDAGGYRASTVYVSHPLFIRASDRIGPYTEIP
ncbi:MAG: hypothetical protein V1870_00615 [Candidatus Aenigmatarchaeota archaeon]